MNSLSPLLRASARHKAGEAAHFGMVFHCCRCQVVSFRLAASLSSTTHQTRNPHIPLKLPPFKPVTDGSWFWPIPRIIMGVCRSVDEGEAEGRRQDAGWSVGRSVGCSPFTIYLSTTMRRCRRINQPFTNNRTIKRPDDVDGYPWINSTA